MALESQSPEHAITLPLVSKDKEDSRLPLVIDVIAKYWGEDLAPTTVDTEAASTRGSALITGIRLAEKKGLVGYIYKGSIKDLKKRIDQGIPPIVIMPGIRGIVQHALIVSGYNEEERRILTYVAEPDTVGAIPEGKFAEDWNQDEMTTIVLVPQDMKELMESETLQFRQSNRMCFEAEGLRQQKDIDGAIAKLLTAIQIDQNNAQAWCLLAGIYNDLGDEETESCYQRALTLNSQYYLAFRGLGNYFLKKEDYSVAEGYYTKAIAVNPNRFGPIYKNRAIARMQLGNKTGAKDDLIRYLEQMPNADDKQNIEQAITEL